MTSVQFVSDTQHMHRTTSVPTIAGGATMCMWLKITSYANWGNPMALSSAGDQFCGMEFDSGGNLYFHTGGSYQSVNASTGSYTGWIFVAFTVTTGTMLGYYHKDGGSWTALSALTETPSGTMNSIGFAWESAFGEAHGTIRAKHMRVWNVVLTSTELQAERDSATAVKTSNLVFRNEGTSAASVGTDATSTGNMTVAGSPTDVADDPPVGSTPVSNVPGSCQRNLRHNGIYRMAGRDELAPQHRGLFASEKKIHVVPALPASMQRRQRAISALRRT